MYLDYKMWVNYIKLKFSLFLGVWFIAGWFLAADAVAASLDLSASGNAVSIINGGVYSNINISGSARPVLNITSNALTLTGISSSTALISGPTATAIQVDGTRLSLGAATKSAGGVLSGSIDLVNGGVLRVYGGTSSSPQSYTLKTVSPSSGAITGDGAIELRKNSILQTGAIGTQAAPVDKVSLEDGASFFVSNGLWASHLTVDSSSVVARSGDIHAQNVTLSGAGSSLVATKGNLVLGNVTSTSPGDELFAQNGIEADDGNVEITGALKLPGGLTRIAATGDVTIRNGTATPATGGLGQGALYLRAGGNVNADSGYLHHTTIEALKMTIADDLTAANVTAAQLSAKSVTTSGNLVVTGSSLEIFGHKVSYGLLDLDNGNSGSASTIGGNLQVTDSKFHAGILDIAQDAEIKRVTGNFADMAVKGDFDFGAGTLYGGNLTAREMRLGDRQFSTSLEAASIKAASMAAGRNRVDVHAKDIAVSGIISGSELFTLVADGNISAGSLEAGRVEADNLKITSGALSLHNGATSIIHHDLEINGKGSEVDNGEFQSLQVGGALRIAGAGLSGESLAATQIIVGGEAQSQLSTRVLASGAKLDVIENGQISLGQKGPEWLDSALAGIRQQKSPALGVYAPITLAGANVGKSISSQITASGFHFASGSVLVVNAEAAKEGRAPTGIISASALASAKIDNGAKLLLDGVSANSVYGVLGHNIATAYAGNLAWEGENLETNSHFISARKIAGRNGWFTTSPLPAGSVYPDLDPGIAEPIDEGVAGGNVGSETNHFDSKYAGVRFISRTGSTTYMDHDYRLAVKTLESATRIAVLGAVPQMTYAANTAATEAAQSRGGFAADAALSTCDCQENARNFALWIMPLFHSINQREFPANNFNYDVAGNLGGIIFGADWTFGGSLRVGLDASLGGGHSKSGGDLAKTENDMGFVGLGLYAGWQKDSLTLSADVHYTASWNSIIQELPVQLHMRDITGDFTGRALSVSIRSGYSFVLDENWSLSPYVGVRYTWLLTDKYTVYSNGALLDGEKVEQSIWTFPCGLELNGIFKGEDGWAFSPALNLGVIPAAGDLSGRTKVRYTGVPGQGNVESQIMDYTAFFGSLGLEMLKENLAFGLKANLKAGRHGEEKSLFGVFRYEF